MSMKGKSVCIGFAVVLCISISSAQVTGSGTKGAVAVWTGSTSLGNSPIAAVSGNIGIGTTKPGAKLDVESTSTTKPAVIGASFGTTGSTTGVYGLSGSPTGYGVLGQNYTTTGSGAAIGVFGLSSNPVGQGVNGTNSATSGTGIGVAAESASDNGVAVSAHAISTTGFPQAFYGDTNSPGGVVALLRSQAGSDIITGQSGVGFAAVDVFRVDVTGKGYFDGGTQTGGADFAESVAIARGSDRHEPGDLLIVDTAAKRQLKLATEPYSTLVAGIYSTKPGVLATTHKMGESATNEIPLAIVGIVPCKVSTENGAIQPGDLLVTSSTPGHAMKGTDRSKMLGAVVGKALEPLTEGKGVIQVLVTLQ
jgi:hypothetical protein